ncbi:MAG: ROK family protein [Alicyclobacillus sp.]|nr:ROK family protein [Alicyclobacillus sp.]
MQARHLGVIDIGGTKTLIGVANPDRVIVHVERLATAPESGPQDLVRRVVETFNAIADRLGFAGPPEAVGVSVPGPLNRAQGVVHFTGNLGWRDYPLAKELSDALGGVPVSIDDDGNCAGLGEARFGAGRGYEDQVYLTISTGIGAAIIVNGRVHHGHQDLAGEVGHLTIVPDGPPCSCGNFGCLEALSSGTAIARAASQAVLQDRSAYLSSCGRSPTAEDVVAGAVNGDVVCREILSRAAKHLGVALANVVHVLNPQAVVVGGGVMAAADLILPVAEAEMDRHLFVVQRGRVVLKPAALGSMSGLWGALCLVTDETTSS